jgi:hypothetical protein
MSTRFPIASSRLRVVAIAGVAVCAVAALRCSSTGPAHSGFGGDGGDLVSSDAAHDARLDGLATTHTDGALQPDAKVLCTDCDHDGYIPPEDCDDFNALINPDAYDFIGDGIDNDCDGKVDNPVVTCETIPASPPGSPSDFARAADLCAQRAITHTGKPFDPVVNAAWGQVSGLGTGQTLWTSTTKNEQVNIVSSFGMNSARVGQTMFGLSNGPWGALTPRTSPALDPAGFNLLDACSDIPLVGDDCLSLQGSSLADAGAPRISVQDWGELTLWIQVPVNASGLSFNFAFFSSEFNEWWQSSANDAFFALVTSKTIKGTNVAKGADGLGVTVNSSFFQLCPTYPGPAGLQENVALMQCVGVDGSSTVPGSLEGTGYDGAGYSTNVANAPDTVQSIEEDTYIYGGGSGWLNAAFGVTPGEELELRIVIMDTFDGIKDSVVLVDGFTWQATPPGVTGVTRPPK